MNINKAETRAMYWIITFVLLIWGVAYAWLVAFSWIFATPEDFSKLVEQGRILPEYVDYIDGIPTWAIAVTFIAAITRLGGAILLVMRSRAAYHCYLVSLVCVIVIMVRGFVFDNAASVIRPSQIGVEALFMVMSVLAVWFAATQIRKEVLDGSV